MVVRPPPPLQLRDDNTRLGRRLQSHSSSSDSIFSRLYDASWRNLILIVATINAIRYFCSVLVMAGIWNELELGNASLRSRQLRSIILAIAIVYSLTGLIELFGGVSALTRRLRLIRLYAHLAAISALLVTVAGILIAVTHFTFADEVIKHCMSQAMKTNGQNGLRLIFRSTPSGVTLQAQTPPSIESSCLNKWSSQSSVQILAIFLCYLLPSTIYYIVVYTYYRQCLDPHHPASLFDQTLTRSGKHPYARLINEPMTATTRRVTVCSPGAALSMVAAFQQQLSASLSAKSRFPVYGHYRNGMCARHRPDGSLIVKPRPSQGGNKNERDTGAVSRRPSTQSTHHHHHHQHNAESSSGSVSDTTQSLIWYTTTRSTSQGPGRRAMARIQLERTVSDRSDGSMVTVSPGPPSYSGVVYDDRYKLGDDHGDGNEKEVSVDEFVN